MLHCIHECHQGIVKCRERERHSVWWPGLSAHEDIVYNNCPVCVKERVQRPEPLNLTKFPSCPWRGQTCLTMERMKGSKCLLIVDYFSGFIVIGGKHVGEVGKQAVQTIKHLLQKAEDPYKSLLAYRSNPLHNIDTAQQSC